MRRGCRMAGKVATVTKGMGGGRMRRRCRMAGRVAPVTRGRGCRMWKSGGCRMGGARGERCHADASIRFLPYSLLRKEPREVRTNSLGPEAGLSWFVL